MNYAKFYYNLSHQECEISGENYFAYSPKKLTFLENYENHVIYQRIYYQNDYHEYMQKLFIPDNETNNFFYAMSSLVSESFKIYQFQNVYITSYFPAILNETDIILPWKSREQIPEFTININSVSYENVIFPNSIFGYAFGHYFSEILPAILSVPSDILKKSYILLQCAPSIALTFIELLDIDVNKILFTDKYYIQANNLYVLKPRDTLISQLIYGYPLLASKLKQKLNLNSIVPTKYLLANREKKRRLNNFKNLVESIEFHFPSKKWEILNCSFNNIYQLAPVIASAKFFFSSCGSNIHNCILMHNYTGVCLALSDRIDWPNYLSLYIAKIWAMGFRNPNMVHHNPKGGICSIPIAIFCIEKVLYAIDYQKWPNITSSITLFDINRTKQIMDNYQDSIISRVYFYKDYINMRDIVMNETSRLNITFSKE